MAATFLGVKNVPNQIKTLLSVHADLTGRTQAEVLTTALTEYFTKHSLVKPKGVSGLTAATQLDRIEAMLVQLVQS